MSTQTEPNPPQESDRVMSALEQYAAYPFESDDIYKAGLASILAGGALNGNPAPEVREEILRRTRVFYFNKTIGSAITMDEAREFEQSLRASDAAPEATSSSQSKPSTSSDETQVLTFAELKELIESGKVDQIPNNKIIPEKFSDEAPSQSTAPVRKKPWETAATSVELS